jgi:mRNA interferase RelE/StbE
VAYEIKISPTALNLLRSISDRRIRDKLVEKIDQLATSPEKQGKPLVGELTGYRSVRAAGQRYRIIYRIEENQVVVLVVALGLRKEGSRRDVYELAQKLIRVGLLE